MTGPGPFTRFLHNGETTTTTTLARLLEIDITDSRPKDAHLTLSHVFIHSFHRGFHMVTGLYGRKFNGYMGVALAFPTDEFEVIDVNIARLSDTRSWPPKDDKKPLWANLLDTAVAFPFKILGMQGREEKDPWEYSEYRLNVMTSVTLKDRVSGDAFCIGTYHMPCAYFAPQVMTIHADVS